MFEDEPLIEILCKLWECMQQSDWWCQFLYLYCVLLPCLTFLFMSPFYLIVWILTLKGYIKEGLWVSKEERERSS